MDTNLAMVMAMVVMVAMVDMEEDGDEVPQTSLQTFKLGITKSL